MHANASEQYAGTSRKHIDKKRAIAAEIVIVALMGFSTSMMPAIAEIGFDNTMFFYIISGALILCFSAIAIAHFDKGELFVLFIMPVLVLAVSLLPLIGSGMRSFGSALQPAGNIAFELVLLQATVLLARMIDESPARIFMIGRLSLALFDLLGAFVGSMLVNSINKELVAQTAGIMLFCACELVLIVLIIGFLGTSRIFKRTEIEGYREDGYEETAREAADSELAQREVQPIVQEKTQETNQEVAQASIQEKTQTNTQKASRKEASESKEAPELKGTPELKEAQDPIADIAKCFGLSARECDVLRLLAKGRSATRIQEELFISAGTVNYHTRNIYAKMGVHSRQELIDLIHS